MTWAGRLYCNLGVSPVVLEEVHLPPHDRSLGVIAQHADLPPWVFDMTPRTRMWYNEFGDFIGELRSLLVTPLSTTGVGKGVCRRRMKGKGKGRGQPGCKECNIPIYAPTRRGVVRACYRGDDGELVAFFSSGSESVKVAEEEPDSDDTSMSRCHMNKPAFLRKKGIPKPLRYIFEMWQTFQEPMGPLPTPMVTLKHFLICGFPGTFFVIGSSLRYAGVMIIISGSSWGVMI